MCACVYVCVWTELDELEVCTTYPRSVLCQCCTQAHAHMHPHTINFEDSDPTGLKPSKSVYNYA